MRTKDINTLAELRASKMELNQKMKRKDFALKDNLIKNGLKWLMTGRTKKQSNSDLTHSGIQNTIGFLASKTKNSNGLKKLAKPVLSIALVIAVPFLARKAGKLIKKKS